MEENTPNQGMSEPVIRFKCDFCGKQIRVPSIHAGKKGKCPQCKNPVVIPPLTLPPAAPRDDEPIRLMRDADLPPDAVGPINASPQQWHRSASEPPAGADAYKTVPPPEQKPATLLDVFAFPFSMSGVIHLLLFWFGPFLLGLFARVFAFACCYFQILVLGLYIAMIGYLYYYLSNCVIAAAKDERLAPDVSLDDPPAFTDLLRRFLLILGGTLICFGPALLYMLYFYILPAVGHFWVGHAEPLNWRADHVYWFLYGFGIFLYPMFMLAVSMFDSAAALNPFLIIGSIARTFLPYCGLAVIFCAIGLFINLISRLQPGGIPLLIWGFDIYLAFVAAYILGRFFRRYENRLLWEIKL
jgi:hypothetical protein